MDLERLNRDLIDALAPRPDDPLYGTVVDVDALALQALVLVRSAKNARWIAIQGSDLATQLDVRAEAGERVRVLIQNNIVVGMAATSGARRANLTQNSVNPNSNAPTAQTSFALIGIGGPAPTITNKAEVYGNMKVRGQINIVPGSAMPPLVLGANAQGQTVVGFRADQLNKNITAGDGLAGGGTLTADRTLAVDTTVLRTTGHALVIASASVLGHIKVGSSLTINAGTGVLDVVPGTTTPGPHASTHSSGGSDPITISNLAGTITDAQHGSKTTGTLHAAVVAAGASGFMTGADKTKLDGITSGASVSSVAMTVPSFLSVTGSPVTTSGTLAVSLANQSANTFLAGPTSGGAATPTFRAPVSADIPPINLASTANGGVTGTLPVTNGGTGQVLYAVGDILYASTTTALSKLADAATGNALISGGAGVAPSYGKIGLTTHISGTLPVANGGTNITSYAVGDLLYASASGTLSKLADVASGQVLRSGGVGIAPAYGQVVLTTDVSGILPIANGGTNASTAPAALVNLNAAVAGQVFGVGTGITGGGTHGTTTSSISFAVDQAFSPTWTGTHIFNLQPTIAANLSFSGARSITSTSTNNLTLAPGGDLLLDPVGNDVLPVTGYDINLGSLSQKYLTLHAAELWVETLVAQNTIATIGGRILVGPTTTLTSDLTNVATSIVVKHNQMASGDRVYMEANGAVEFMAITSAPSGTGPYTYTVTRNLDGTGANAWSAGDAVFNTGTTGNGFIDLYSVRGVKSSSQAGPTVVMNVRNSATFNDWSEHAAIGNLNGNYDYSTNVYGAAFGKQTSHWLGIDATSGIRFMVNTTQYANWATSGSITVGRTTLSNVQINTGGDLLLVTNGTTKVKLDNAGIVTVGENANDRHFANITTSGIAFIYKNTSAVDTSMMTMNTNVVLGVPIPYMLVGPITTGNLYAFNGDIFLRQGVTNYITLNNSGAIVVGATGNPQLTMTGSVLQLKDAGGVVGFQVNTSGNLNLLGVLDIGSSGGIYQGSGTFASPTTGLKIWNASGTGRIAGYNAGVEQWGAQTDGTFTAGAGHVVLNSDGLRLTSTGFPHNSVKWQDSAHGSADLLYISGTTTTGLAMGDFIVVGTDTTINAARARMSAIANDALSSSELSVYNNHIDAYTTAYNLYDQNNVLVLSYDSVNRWVFPLAPTFSDGIVLPRTGEGVLSGTFTRFREVPVSTTNLGTAGSASITVNAYYDDVTDNRWEFTSAGFGGIAVGFGMGPNFIWSSATGGTTGSALTWVNQMTLTSAGVLSTASDITAGGVLSGTNISASFVGGAGTAVVNTQQVIAGNGLITGGAFGAGNVTLALGTPSNLTVATTNGVTTTSHTHAITSSSAPGAAVSLLATSASGAITLNGTIAKVLTAFQTADVTNSFLAQTNRNYETGITFYANRAATTVDWAYQLVTPSTWTDVTLELQEAAGTAIQLFPTGATTTQMHMGAAAKFTELYYLASVLGVGGTYVWEYSTGVGTWSTLTTVGTADFTVSGYVTWTDPGAGWVTATYNGQTGFWIRVRPTVAPSTAPTAQAWNISIANGDFFRGTTGNIIKYRLNINGNITTAGTIALGDGLAGTSNTTFTGNVLSGYSGGLKTNAQFQVASVLGVGATPVSTTQALVQATATGNIGLQVSAFSGASTANIANFWTSASQGWSFDKLGRPIHIQTTAPTVTAGAGAGTGTGLSVTVAAGSTDVIGTITIATGSTVAPTASSTILTLTFSTAWGTAPKWVELEPASANAALLAANWPYWSATSTTTATLTSTTTALAPGITYIFRYHVIG